MLRIVCCICLAVLFSGCEKNWRGLVIEKRVYRDGYYVHLPWKRYTPVNEYPKPEQYPVQYTRVSGSDSTKTKSGGAGVVRTASATGVSGDSTTRNSPVQVGGGPAIGPGSNAGGGANGGGAGGGGAGGGGIGGGPNSPPPNGTTGTGPVAGYYPAPPLEPLPPVTTPPLPPPPVVVAPPDSAVAANDSLPVQPADTVANNDRGFDFPEGEFALIAEAGFYNPVYTSGAAIKPFSYNAGASLRYTIHPWSRHKISAECGLFISNLFISQDQHKFSPLFIESYDKERIMQWKSRFMLMDHIYFSRKEDAKFDAVELGVFSDLGLFSTHVAVDYHGNDEKAMLIRSKTRLFGLNYLRTVQYGLTARIANDVWSVFANYRLSNMLKAGPDTGDLPKLLLGATFAFGE